MQDNKGSVEHTGKNGHMSVGYDSTWSKMEQCKQEELVDGNGTRSTCRSNIKSTNELKLKKSVTLNCK